MKKTFLTVGLIFLMLLGHSEGNRLYQLYVKSAQGTYYLSAPYGGGDEMITKKITGEPGDYESFLFEFVEGNQHSTTLFCRIKTFYNYYLSLTDDGELIAEEKEVKDDQLFEVKMTSLRKSDTVRIISRRETEIIKMNWLSISIGKRMQNGAMSYLAFQPGAKNLEMTIPLESNPIFLSGKSLDISRQVMTSLPSLLSYELKWLAPEDVKGTKMLASFYHQDANGLSLLYNSIKWEPMAGPVICSLPKDVSIIQVKPLKGKSEDYPIKNIALWRGGQPVAHWDIDKVLKPGQQIELRLDGSYRVY